MVITEKMVDAALEEYNLALSSDPRNTEAMRNSARWPQVFKAMRTDAMREALTAAFAKADSEA